MGQKQTSILQGPFLPHLPAQCTFFAVAFHCIKTATKIFAQANKWSKKAQPFTDHQIKAYFNPTFWFRAIVLHIYV